MRHIIHFLVVWRPARASASTAIRSILERYWNPGGESNISMGGDQHGYGKVAQKLTQRFVETVTVGQNRSEYRDGHTGGLVLRVTPKGIKSWAVLYRRKSDGRKRRYTIGTYPEFSLAAARTQAEAIVARVSRGEDPAARVQARNAAFTFEQLAETWVTRHGRPNKGARSLYVGGKPHALRRPTMNSADARKTPALTMAQFDRSSPPSI
jgi:Arm domain-containing DNA-binding protein